MCITLMVFYANLSFLCAWFSIFHFIQADDLSDDFALVLIDHLKKVFLASRDAQEQNCCAFAIQEVLSVLKCADANAGKTRYC